MAYDITCADPLHESRSELPGWVTILGSTDVDPNVKSMGMICPACAGANPNIIPPDVGKLVTSGAPIYIEEEYDLDGKILRKTNYAYFDGNNFSQKVEEIAYSYAGDDLETETVDTYDHKGNIVNKRRFYYSITVGATKIVRKYARD